jgi:inner membrane protein
MLGVSHLLISGTATSLILGTADPSVLLVGAIAGLLPDVDISTSPAGRVLPWVSTYFERRFPHRSCTHSLLATGIVAIAGYSLSLVGGDSILPYTTALSIGYFFGWFADVFTRGGVEMFYPSPVRCVCPGNRKYRLRTGSNAEYGILALLLAIAFFAFNINSKGGILTQFNQLIASPSGVEHLYNESGSTHLITAHIKGVATSDRSKVLGDYLIVEAHGQGFIVQSSTGQIYKAGTEPDAQIFTEKITADVGSTAITNIESLALDEEELGEKLNRFNRIGAMVFVTGQLTVDDPESIRLIQDPRQFPTIRASGAGNITLEAAPLATVQQVLGDQFATGQLQIRRIDVSQAATNASSQTQ